MTDPVSTDALREQRWQNVDELVEWATAAADELDRVRDEADVNARGIEFMDGVQHAEVERLTRLLRAAEQTVVASARDRKRLRTAIEDAPHDQFGCGLVHSQQRTNYCNCWKADALG